MRQMAVPSNPLNSWRLIRSISAPSRPPHCKASGIQYSNPAHFNVAMGGSSGSSFLSSSWTSLLPCFSGLLHSSTTSSSALTSSLTAHCCSSSSQLQPTAESEPSKGIQDAAGRIKALFAACEGAFGGGREPSDEQLKHVQQALGANQLVHCRPASGLLN